MGGICFRSQPWTSKAGALVEGLANDRGFEKGWSLGLCRPPLRWTSPPLTRENQGNANLTNEPLKPKSPTPSRTDMITFQEDLQRVAC